MTSRLRVEEAAAILRTTAQFIRAELRRKNLRGTKIGGQWTVTPGDLDAYIEAHANVRPVKR